MFTACNPFPGIFHITDEMGVSFTLVEGEDSALVFDAGYGTEDVASYLRTLTDRPFELILSHGHHDHMLGAQWFDHSLMDAADLEEFRLRAGSGQREKVRRQADERGVTPHDGFMTAEIPEPLPLKYLDTVGPFDCCVYDLGNREAWVLRVPGHTPGSVVLYIPDLQLLLTGDDWNPCTWMWFPCSLPVRQWHANMILLLSALEKEAGGEVLHVLCSHQPNLREGTELKEYLAWVTEDRLQSAPYVDTGTPINAHEMTDPGRGWALRFDADK